ncbi:MAG: T9SS type A sorting domain-containing protein [Flavobacterium sp.]|nr:MAG: T9SS type A sorting domain-containing protein [Flavobacterium sp.]
MKKTLLTTILLFALSVCRGQEYHPLLENPSWNVAVASFTGTYNFTIEPGQNITISGTIYKQFHDPFYDTDVQLREDVSTKRVYRLVEGVEQLLYDFSLTDGQMITLPNGITYTASVSEINVSDGTRKEIVLNSGFSSGGTWIEGVGDTSHPLVPYYSLMSDPYIYLVCSAQDGTNIYNRGIANGGEPTDCSMLLSVENVRASGNALFPNPCVSMLQVNVSEALRSATLIASNMLGQKVLVAENLNGAEASVDVSALSKGLYVIQLYNEGKIIFTGKVLVGE